MTALDLVWGRGGGRRLDTLTTAEEAADFDQAVADGKIVHAACGCSWWWLARRDVGQVCRGCDQPMVARRNWRPIDDRAALVAVLPSAEHERLRDRAGWIILDRAIGECIAGDGPCRSWDPQNRPRHLCCGIKAAA